MFIFRLSLVILLIYWVKAGDHGLRFLESDKIPTSKTKYSYEGSYSVSRKDFWYYSYDGECAKDTDKYIRFTATYNSSRIRQSPGKQGVIESEINFIHLEIDEHNITNCDMGGFWHDVTHYTASVSFSGFPKDFTKEGVTLDLTFVDLCGYKSKYNWYYHTKEEICLHNVRCQVVFAPVDTEEKQGKSEFSDVWDSELYREKVRYTGIESEAKTTFSFDNLSYMSRDFQNFDCVEDWDTQCDSFGYLGKSEKDGSYQTIIRKPTSNNNQE